MRGPVAMGKYCDNEDITLQIKDEFDRLADCIHTDANHEWTDNEPHVSWCISSRT